MPEYLHPGVYIQEEPSGARPIEAASTSTACFVGTASRGRPDYPTFITNFEGFVNGFGGLTKASHMPLSVYQFFQNGGKRTYIVRVLPDAAKVAEGTLSGIGIRAAGKGAWGNDIKVNVSLNRFSGPATPSTPPDPRPVLYDWIIEVRDADGDYKQVEAFFSLGVKEAGDRFYASVLNRDSNYIDIALGANGEYPEGSITIPSGTTVAEVPLAGGEDGEEPPTATDYARAVNTLDRIDDVSILAIPGVTPDANSIDIALVGSTYASRRRDMIYVLDPPGSARDTRDEATQIAAVKAFLENYSNKESYTALYFPWVEVPDPYSSIAGATRYSPPSGFIAGLYARTDNTRGVWKAPAGTGATILGAVGLGAAVTDGEQDDLNPRGVNCIRQFAASGIVCWGARTLSTVSNPEYRYVPVRRFAIFLEKSLFRGTQWVVFEPNDEPLWAAVRFNLNAFMSSLFRQGALQGGKPDEAYLVKCDGANNVQATIDQGQLHILVAFAPLKPAEFVIIHIQQLIKQ
jgi:phage tail sheath protein FI